MDEQGIESILLFPTYGVTVEHAMRHDVEASFAALGAFNRWLEEDWGFGADGRDLRRAAALADRRARSPWPSSSACSRAARAWCTCSRGR